MRTIKFSCKIYNGIQHWIWKVQLLAFLAIQSSCKKMVDIPAPSASIAENGVFTNSATAISILTGIYGNMSGSSDPTFTGSRSISLLTGLSGDELSLLQGITTFQKQYFTNSLSAVVAPVAGSEHWSPLYNYIFKVNAAVEGLTNEKANALPGVIRSQLLGEAKFLRAFFYFYLVNLYGEVPLTLTSDPKINTNLSRASKVSIYQQIVSDLKDAEGLLSSNYLDQTLLSNTTERVRPTKWAASALLARVYLYIGEWANAEQEAMTVITNTNLYSLVPLLNKVFLKNSQEAIWQLQPTKSSFNTQEAITFIIPASGPNSTNMVFLSKNLLNSFEQNDQRKEYGNWIDTTIYKINATTNDTVYYPYKYKINTPNSSITSSTGSANMTEYFMIFRLAELYLIRAEARAQLGNINGAQSDLNAIRNRAGLGNTTANDKTSLLAAILHERQTELFTEWGNRWFDLKRTGTIDAVMTAVTPQKANGAAWKTYQQLYPLPLSDLNLMPNMVQNVGY